MKIVRIEHLKEGKFEVEDEQGNIYIKEAFEINEEVYRKITYGIAGASLENILKCEK